MQNGKLKAIKLMFISGIVLISSIILLVNKIIYRDSEQLPPPPPDVNIIGHGSNKSILHQPEDPFISNSNTHNVMLGKIREAIDIGHSDSSEISEGIQLGKEIYKLINNKDWGELMNFINSMQQISSEVLQIILYHALQQDAPLSVVIDLLNQGATLPGNTIFMLVIKGQLTKIIELQNYGLDIFYSEPSIGNSVNVAVKYKSKLSILNLLLHQGVSTDIRVNGLDPLDIALSDYFKNGKNIEVVSKLIEYDSAIELSHIQIVESNRESELEYYNNLVINIPIFAR
ncbi:hypothetical protein [Shewanella sp. MBTL60-007]|uniref:hypothetical protein n=1 Tax=Shewanella sp. MBTL60-007 TaxID=2815911 RepID=UPI001BBA1A30|nr:hypothetical protein [Shewanella sp. MBTL60-007]GIU31861.1 hypothetical protein TUM3792_43940 [Shewanella sp. MBTL60-007]